MSLAELDKHMKSIRRIISDYTMLEQEKRAVQDEKRHLERQMASSETLRKKIKELEGSLEDARRTKKTLQKVEGLQARVNELEERNKFLEDRLAEHVARDDNAKVFLERLSHIAVKLKIRPGSRTPKELLGAIEDSIRKLMSS